MDNNTRYLIIGIIVIAIIALIGLSYTFNSIPVPTYNETFNNTTNSTPGSGTAPGGNMTITQTANLTAMPTR